MIDAERAQNDAPPRVVEFAGEDRQVDFKVRTSAWATPSPRAMARSIMLAILDFDQEMEIEERNGE